MISFCMSFISLHYCIFCWSRELLTMTANQLQQILFLSLILCQCAVVALDKGNASFSSVVNDLEKFNLRTRLLKCREIQQRQVIQWCLLSNGCFVPKASIDQRNKQ